MISHKSPRVAAEVLTDIRQNVGYFVEAPELRLGDADSGHGVLFGRLSQYGEVAIKPYIKLAHAKTEQRNLEKVRSLGFETLDPLLVAAGGVAAYLVTARRRDLRHLGQTNWHANVASKELSTVIKPTLGRVATTLAAWHAADIFHGDAQAKNIAFDAQGNSVYVDAEKTQHNPKGQLRLQLAQKDIGFFGVSVLARRLLYDKSASYRIGFLTDAFLDPYLEAAGRHNADLGGGAQRSAVQSHWNFIIDRGWTPAWVRAALEQPPAVSLQEDD